MWEPEIQHKISPGRARVWAAVLIVMTVSCAIGVFWTAIQYAYVVNDFFAGR